VENGYIALIHREWSKGVYLLFYHAQSCVTTRKEAVSHSKKLLHHVKASTSVKPLANVKPNLISQVKIFNPQPVEQV